MAVRPSVDGRGTEAIAPLTQRHEYLEGAGAFRQGAAGQVACQRRQVAAQEGVGGQLFVQLPRQRGLPLGAQQQRVLQALGYPFIVGFGLSGKVQVGDGYSWAA